MYRLSYFLLALIYSIQLQTEGRHSMRPTETESMFRTANQVLNDLKRVKGILPSEAPSLKVYQFRGNGKLASMHLEKGEVHLDSETYLICRRMGSDSLNALAFLLGHELGHYINAHGGLNHNLQDAGTEQVMQFEPVMAVMELTPASASVNFEDRLSAALEEFEETHDEAEADFEGAFLAYLAGYEALDAGKKFLTKAYAKFQLDTLTSGYPTLLERLEIIDNTAKDVAKLSPVFEAAQYLVALGQYGDAIPLLERILEKFESPEIYNNLAVSIAMHIQGLFEERITRFLFPLTYDVSFRAPHPQVFLMQRPDEFSTVTHGPGFPPCEPNILHLKLDEAESFLKKSIFLDEDYALAYMNLSIIRTLKGALYSIDNQSIFLEPDSKFSNCLQAQWDEYGRALGDALSARKFAQELSEKGNHQRSLLSNIWTQIDIVRILLDQHQDGFLKYVDPDNPRTKIPRPVFARALAFNPSNIYALRNRAIHTQQPFTPPEQAAATSEPCKDLELINDKTINQLVNEVQTWNFVDVTTTSKFFNFFISNKALEREEIRRLHIDQFPATHTLHYKKTPEFSLYKIVARVDNTQVREEETTALAIPTIQNQTICGTRLNTTLVELAAIHGKPNSTLLTNQGTLFSYQQKFQVREEPTEHPDILSFLDDQAPPAEKKITEKDGFIFHINQENKVEKWAVYHEMRSTELLFR